MFPSNLDLDSGVEYVDWSHNEHTVICTVVKADTYAYIDSFLDKKSAQDHIAANPDKSQSWIIIEKILR